MTKDELAEFNIITGRLDMKLQVYEVLTAYKAELLAQGHTVHSPEFMVLNIVHSRIGSIEHTDVYMATKPPIPKSTLARDLEKKLEGHSTLWSPCLVCQTIGPCTHRTR